MRYLSDCKEDIHSCSKCGLCQSVCPIYKITGNDCTVSRGHFIMLNGLIKGDLKMSKTINRYLDLCLKCSACSKFCPSGIDVVDIVALAKAEYFKKHFGEKFNSWIQKNVVFGIGLNFIKHLRTLFNKDIKSEKYDKKVIYFGGCASKVKTNNRNNVVKILNSVGIEVITPDFNCCGLPFYVRGDMENFEKYMKNFYEVCDKYETYDIVTNCASCEKMLKSYEKWNSDRKITVKNIFDLINESDKKPELKKEYTVTYHKPCNLNNYEVVDNLLKNTKNLTYLSMQDYDKCCGFNGISRFSEYKIMLKIFKEKRKNIINSRANIVLTSCLACEIVLKLISFGRYKVYDYIEFLVKNIKD